MNSDKIIENNKNYWNEHADLWFGTTALPVYGVRFPTEDDLHLFGDVTGKKMLEICCGSGHSLKYNAEKGAGELWGVDLSQKQLDNAAELLKDNGYSAKLICSKMEDELDVPRDYFDYVYSIYGIGWTTDLQINTAGRPALRSYIYMSIRKHPARFLRLAGCSYKYLNLLLIFLRNY